MDKSEKVGRKGVASSAPEPGSPIAPQREPKRLRTPEEQRAEIERVAREHGADLSEEGFNEALKKLGKRNG